MSYFLSDQQCVGKSDKMLEKIKSSLNVFFLKYISYLYCNLNIEVVWRFYQHK